MPLGKRETFKNKIPTDKGQNRSDPVKRCKTTNKKKNPTHVSVLMNWYQCMCACVFEKSNTQECFVGAYELSSEI